MIDFYFSKNDMTALNMMNTKYFINEKGALQTNSGAMGNAWFVDTVLTVSTPDEEIASIKNIDPASQAIFLASDFDHLEIPLRFNICLRPKINNWRYFPKCGMARIKAGMPQ